MDLCDPGIEVCAPELQADSLTTELLGKWQKEITLKDELPRSVSGYYATGIRGEITPERMKRWSQSKNNTQV